MNVQESTQSVKTSVNISDILQLPVQCTIPNRHMIEKFVEIAKNNPKELPIIRIGQVNGKLYALNNLDVLQGCKKAGPNIIKQIVVDITNYNSLKEIIVKHFHYSINETVFNPLSLFDTIDILQENGINKNDDVIEKLWIKDTIYEKLLRTEYNHISSKSIEQLQNIINTLSDRRLTPSIIQVPLYVIGKLSRIADEFHQLALINQISVMLSNMHDGKFAWPTPEQIDTMYSIIKNSFYIEKEETENQSTQDNESSTKSEPKSRTKKEETKSYESNESDYSFPDEILNHLNSSEIRHKNFDSTHDLNNFIQKLAKRDDVKLTLLWSYG